MEFILYREDFTNAAIFAQLRTRIPQVEFYLKLQSINQWINQFYFLQSTVHNYCRNHGCTLGCRRIFLLKLLQGTFYKVFPRYHYGFRIDIHIYIQIYLHIYSTYTYIWLYMSHLHQTSLEVNEGGWQWLIAWHQPINTSSMVSSILLLCRISKSLLICLSWSSCYLWHSVGFLNLNSGVGTI